MKVIKRDEGAGGPDAFDQLAGEAAALQGEGAGEVAGDQAQPAGQGGGDAAPQLTNAQCVTMAAQVIRETLCAVARVESPRRTLDDSTLATVGDAVGTVLDKHGISLAGMAGDYLAELRAMVVVVPVLLAAREALRDELRARNAKPVQPETEPAAPAATNGDQ